MRDRSLDEFVADDGDDDDPGRDSNATSSENPDPNATSNEDPDVPRPDHTMRWDAGATCPACGASAPRRWREGDRFVCADCKEW